MKTSTHSKKTNQTGFSLFEMLTFVCILGIMVTLAIPLFGSTDQVSQATSQKNAQTICSLAAAASAAGVEVASVAGEEVTSVLRRLSDGVTVTRGPLAGRVFKVPHMSDEQLAGASRFIVITNGELIYNSDISVQRSL